MASSSDIEFTITARDDATRTLRRIRREARLTGLALRRAYLLSLIPWAVILLGCGVLLGYCLNDLT
jgi:hypothetical protein